MTLKIGSRKSDLARLQAYEVARALQSNLTKAAQTELAIEYLFKSSFGDENLTESLSQMPEKGVFTKDLTDDLLAGRLDVVVHSWKDLPTEDAPGTEII